MAKEKYFGKKKGEKIVKNEKKYQLDSCEKNDDV